VNRGKVTRREVDKQSARIRQPPENGATALQSRSSRRIPTPFVAFVCATLWSVPAASQEVDQRLGGVNPGVTLTAVAVSGSTLYVGGSFTSAGPVSGGGAIVDPWSAAVRGSSPRVAGIVITCIGDGRGGWYLGGTFAGVGGLPRTNLAHVFGDGHVDAWAPNPNGTVFALALSGGTLFAGGAFTQLGGAERRYVGAVDVGSGRATAWNPGADVDVRALLVMGGDVYLGGWFTTIEGQPRPFLASVDATTGRVSAWAPQPSYPVFALASCGDTLFAGGAFFTIGDVTRPRLAAFDTRTGALTAWDAHLSRLPEYRYDLGPTVWSLLVSGDRLYAAGAFNRVGAAVRPGLAAINTATAAADDWDPQVALNPLSGVPATLFGLALDGTTLYVAGLMDTLGGEPVGFAGALDTKSASRLPWDPRTNDFVEAFGVTSTSVFVGGQFTSIGPSVPRHGLAAFDLTTGEVTPWDPNPDGQPYALAMHDGTVFVGGGFGYVGGQQRSGIAALDPLSGQATEWNPACGGFVNAIAFGDTTVYIGGGFGSIAGQARSSLGEVGLRSGLATGWNPQPNDVVTSIVARRGLVYVGGWFTSLGTNGHAYAAAVDPTSGIPTAWDPRINNLVNCVAVDDTTVYLGGYFTQIGGQERDGFGAASAISGGALALRADVDQNVKEIVVHDGVVYVGGAFHSFGGVPRFCLAALEPNSSRVLDWNPDPDAVVWAMTADDRQVYPAGAFARMGTSPAGLVSGLSLATRTSMPPATGTAPRLQFIGVTNPCRTTGVVHFVLQSDAMVDLDVFDMQSRRVKRLLDHSPQAAGEHEIPVDTTGWPPGLYYYRLVGGSDRATRKMVVLP
jgi:hypothetical protein